MGGLARTLGGHDSICKPLAPTWITDAQGWGFKADINGASAGSEAGLGGYKLGGTN